MNQPQSTVLIVEDEEHDRLFLARAFRRSGVVARIETVTNGEEAIAYLQGHGAYADRAQHPAPQFLITDLKMPRMGGLELLQWLDAHPRYRVIPTVILTSSMTEQDVAEAYRYGVSGYFVKPVNVSQLETIARVIADYWTRAMKPRPGPSAGETA